MSEEHLVFYLNNLRELLRAQKAVGEKIFVLHQVATEFLLPAQRLFTDFGCLTDICDMKLIVILPGASSAMKLTTAYKIYGGDFTCPISLPINVSEINLWGKIYGKEITIVAVDSKLNTAKIQVKGY